MAQCFAELPAEIYSAILVQLPRDERQRTVLSLIRAIPRSPVPLYHLFESISLNSAQSVVQLYRRLRASADEARWVQELALETWTVDADVVVNLLGVLPRLSGISLFVGPNFAPEHLEELLAKPREGLRYLSLRFRPYVQRATYYQFLKGAYFDTTLQALSRWPPHKAPALSIVQDPLDPELARTQHFAQPLVFFRLEPITTLMCSPYLQSLTSFRLRIPSRQVAAFISTSPLSAPELRILDLSTCNIRLVDVEALAARFKHLNHLILDGCSIARVDSLGEWAAIGKACVLGTVKAAKEREKKLRSWLERQAERGLMIGQTEHPAGVADPAGRRVRPGRRGLATAMVSLRDPPPRAATPVVHTEVMVPRVRVVPSFPAIRSLSTTCNPIHHEKHDTMRAEFEKGWDEGLAQLTAVRTRLYQSWRNGVRVMRITGKDGTEEGFEGLEDIDNDAAFNGHNAEGAGLWKAPVLCLAGPDRTAQHADGCGHSVANCIWQDGI
ncbi:hypothetical protein F5I97DRAFT_1809443 [Phlebopus sp. FC_14]|nr:hypothetical protein F5I97DRAFT_1809443 [Phlebopus sp. FC_14]